MTDTNVYQFKDITPGSAEQKSALEFLAANDIPADRTPERARMWLGDSTIVIDQFHINEHGARVVSMIRTGFVKDERSFPLKRRPEEFGVQLEPVDAAETNHNGGDS